MWSPGQGRPHPSIISLIAKDGGSYGGRAPLSLLSLFSNEIIWIICSTDRYLWWRERSHRPTFEQRSAAGATELNERRLRRYLIFISKVSGVFLTSFSSQRGVWNSKCPFSHFPKSPPPIPHSHILLAFIEADHFKKLPFPCHQEQITLGVI